MNNRREIDGMNSPGLIFVRITLRKPTSSLTEKDNLLVNVVCRVENLVPGNIHLPSESYKQIREYLEYRTIREREKYKRKLTSILLEFQDWNANGRKEIYDYFIEQVLEIGKSNAEDCSIDIFPIDIGKCDDYVD